MEATNLFVVIYRHLGGGHLNYWIAFITMKPSTKYLNNFATVKGNIRIQETTSCLSLNYMLAV